MTGLLPIDEDEEIIPPKLSSSSDDASNKYAVVIYEVEFWSMKLKWHRSTEDDSIQHPSWVRPHQRPTPNALYISKDVRDVCPIVPHIYSRNEKKNEKWEWETKHWQFDKKRSRQIKIGKTYSTTYQSPTALGYVPVDKDGWEYSTDLKRFDDLERAPRGICRWSDKVRRRRWVRFVCTTKIPNNGEESEAEGRARASNASQKPEVVLLEKKSDLNQTKKKQSSQDFLAEKRPFGSPLGKFGKTKNPFGSPSGKIEETKKPIDLPLGEVDETKNPFGSPLGKVGRTNNPVYPLSGKNTDNDDTKKQVSYFPSDSVNEDFEPKKNKISSLEKVLIDETKNPFGSEESEGEGSASAPDASQKTKVVRLEKNSTDLNKTKNSQDYEDLTNLIAAREQEQYLKLPGIGTKEISAALDSPQKTEAVPLVKNTDFDDSKKEESSFVVSLGVESKNNSTKKSNESLEKVTGNEKRNPLVFKKDKKPFHRSFLSTKSAESVHPSFEVNSKPSQKKNKSTEFLVRSLFSLNAKTGPRSFLKKKSTASLPTSFEASVKPQRNDEYRRLFKMSTESILRLVEKDSSIDSTVKKVIRKDDEIWDIIEDIIEKLH